MTSSDDRPKIDPVEDAGDDLTEPTAGPSKAPKARPSLLRRGGRLVREWGLTLLAVAVVWQVVGWWRAPDLPEMAPTFTLHDLDGGTVSLEDLRGQTVVLNFWAEWCMPCRAEIPSFRRFAHGHPDVRVYGISADGSAASVKAAAEDLGIDYPVLVGDKATLSAYGITTLPTTVVVGPKGEVLAAHTGIMLDPQIAFAARDRDR